ncbi:MAG TPA: FAD-binding protein [Halococcus sp.]|nr:FAD-binding protein [Halococcus sp.]
MNTDPAHDAVIVGGGVAGLTAGIFTARADLDTLVVTHGESILRRNAHLENFPGFPAGVNSRVFLDMTEAQAERAGCAFCEGDVTEVVRAGEGFDLSFTEGETSAHYVIAASWSDCEYLSGFDLDFIEQGSKRFVSVDSGNRTGVPGLYAAGRLAAQYHQTVVSAGDGAQAALTLIEDSDVPFYHDWVAPEGYFTGRDREVPPGCEEIDEKERKRRERESIETMSEYFAEPHPDEPTMHPSVVERREENED